MQRWVALLRGIAPSGVNMTNDKLRGVVEGLGLSQVSSVLSSGNILFAGPPTDTAALEQRIEAALLADLGVTSTTILRSAEELRALVDSDPFAGLTHGRRTSLSVTFLKSRADAPAPELLEQAPALTPVRFDRAAGAVLAVVDTTEGGATPGLMAWLERTCGRDITTRSWLTVQRILAKLES